MTTNAQSPIKVNATRLVYELELISGISQKTGNSYAMGNVKINTPYGVYQFDLDLFKDRNAKNIVESIISKLQDESKSEFSDDLKD